MSDTPFTHLIPARRKDLGGFEVGRILPVAQKRMVGPFVFFDHMGPAHWQAGFPRSVDVRPHPHIGLSTVTYLLDGEITHRDSLGVEQKIHPAEVNWMTAGRGIAHSERFETLRAQGGRLHGLQAWVALPEAHEEDAPAFDHYGADALPTWEDGGAAARLIAGAAHGHVAGVKTHSPLFYVHWVLAPGAVAPLPDDHVERALYVVEGSIELEGHRVDAAQMAVVPQNRAVSMTALQPSVVMTLGGEPLGERYIDWNFVSSRKDRIEQAKDDWRQGRFDLPPTDQDEWIPLP
jgi:hypothetical protein